MEECPICFLLMPINLINCITLQPATISSVPIYDFAIANEELKDRDMETYCPCCGKSICVGCDYSFSESGNDDKCPFCNSEGGKTDEERVEQIMKRVDANDPGAICVLGHFYHHGLAGFQQDQTRAMELFTKSIDLGCSKAHFNLAGIYEGAGNLKKAKSHYFSFFESPPSS